MNTPKITITNLNEVHCTMLARLSTQQEIRLRVQTNLLNFQLTMADKAYAAFKPQLYKYEER